MYSYQDALFGAGTPITRVILVLYLVCSIYYCKKAHEIIPNDRLIKALDKFLLLLMIYGSITLLWIGHKGFIGDSPIDFAKKPLLCLLPIYAFFYFSYNKVITLEWLRTFTILMLITSILAYNLRYTKSVEMLYMSGSNRTDVTNSAAYLFVGLIPCLLFFTKQRITQLILLLVLGFYIISGTKRGAMLIGLVMIAYYMFFYLNKSTILMKLLYLFIFAGAVTLGYYFIESIIATNDYFVTRIDRTLDGDVSGRDNMYPKMICYVFEEANVFNMLFGSGANYTCKVIGNYAHNDWLEILVDCGLIGLIVFFNLCKRLFNIYRYIDSNSLWRYAMGLVLIDFYLKTFFSMSYGDVTLSMSMIIGIAIAQTYIYYDNDNPLQLTIY
jgi:hypothetical protein